MRPALEPLGSYAYRLGDSSRADEKLLGAFGLFGDARGITPKIDTVRPSMLLVRLLERVDGVTGFLWQPRQAIISRSSREDVNAIVPRYRPIRAVPDDHLYCFVSKALSDFSKNSCCSCGATVSAFTQAIASAMPSARTSCKAAPRAAVAPEASPA
jgi:hypothetical protein